MTDVTFSAFSEDRRAIIREQLLANTDIFCRPDSSACMFFAFSLFIEGANAMTFTAVDTGHFSDTAMIQAKQKEWTAMLDPCVHAYGYISRIVVLPTKEPEHPRDAVKVIYCERDGGVAIEIYEVVEGPLQLSTRFSSVQTVDATDDLDAQLFVIRAYQDSGQKPN